MTRHFWVLIHRYAGLTISLFLIVAGLTGSILAFYDEIDDWLNPESSRIHTRVAVQASPLLDPFELRERALKLMPQAKANAVNLQPEPGEAFTVSLVPRIDPATGQPYKLGFDDLKLNPYTGKEIERIPMSPVQEGYFPLTRKNILKFIYALHFQLALGETGGLVFGIVALFWTIDCFVGFYLTFPPRRKQSPSLGDNAAKALSRGRKDWSFWKRWKPAWLIKWPASTLRLNFDLHRAFALWTWAMLFMFAWSSVFFNLRQAYDPLMDLLFENPPEQGSITEHPVPRHESVIDFRAAHTIGKRLMAEQAKLNRFTVKQEAWLSYDETSGLFEYNVTSDRDISEQWVQTYISFDASTGKLLQLGALPTGEYSGLTVQYWLWTLHMARIWGLPYKIFVCVMGLVITMLSVTGVYIWLKKRQASKSKPRKVLTEARIKIQP